MCELFEIGGGGGGGGVAVQFTSDVLETKCGQLYKNYPDAFLDEIWEPFSHKSGKEHLLERGLLLE